MRAKYVVALGVVLGFAGAIAAACSSTDGTSTCDPADPSCATSDGGDGDGNPETTNETSTDDGNTDGGTDGSGDGTVTDDNVPDVKYDAPADVVVVDGKLEGCTPGGTQCTNCVDDDGDGLIDWMDPECTGPLDNRESSFSTGIPGDNIDPCKQDCWFDGNSGSGDDGCLFNGECLVGSKEPKCPYDPVAAKDPKRCPPPTPKCIEFCKPLTPKGCDCAGCCQIFDPSGKAYTVKLVESCHYETLGDPTKCPPCTQIPECSNPCGKCDWCLGKTSLPPECSSPPPDAGTDAPLDGETGTPSTCEGGLTPCSPTSPCPTTHYCLTGCCIKKIG